MRRLLLPLIWLPLLLLSCAKVPEQQSPDGTGKMAIRITAALPDDSKAFLNDKSVYFEDDDCMAVFDGKGRNKFTIVSHSGTTAVFTGQISAEATDLYAVFPYSESQTLEPDGNISLTLPRNQTAGTGGIDPNALVSVAKSTVSEAQFNLKNVVSLVKIDIQQDGVTSLSLNSRAPLQLAGKAKVNPGTAAAELVKESTNEYQATISPATGAFAKGSYYIALFPTEMTEGPVLTIRGADGKATRTGKNAMSCKRNSIVSLGDVTTGASWSAAPEISGKQVKILFLGNSFSEDVCEGWLYDIFKGEGIEAVIGNGYKGSCDLATHWSNASSNTAAYSYRKIVGGEKTVTSSATIKTMLTDEQWDYIVFQQGGGDQGFYSTYEPYLTNLIQYCRTNASKNDFKTVFHYNWAAAKDCTNAKFGKYDYDQMKMYYAQADACAKADSVHHFDLIANTGDAIQNGRNTYLGDTWNRDGWHLEKNYARYCASCLIYEVVTGKSSIGINFRPSTITECVANLCRNCAHCAALHRYRYADLSWIENTDPEPTLDYRVLSSWIFDKTVSIKDGHQASWTGSGIALGEQAKSNAPGLVGYMDANKEGSGRLSYYQIDKSKMTEESAARYILNGTPGGQPAVCGQMGGDWWLFETTGSETFSEGDHLQATFTVYPGKYGAKYWLLEYLDGSEWKPAYTVKHKDLGITSGIDVSSFDYNIELSTSTKTDCKVDVTLTAQTEAFRVRLTCCSTYQVNSKYWDHPRNASEFRIAGTEADGNLPVMKLLFH